MGTNMKTRTKDQHRFKSCELETLLQQLLTVQKQQQEQLVNLNAAVASLYKVKDGLFTFNFEGQDYTFYLPDLPYDFIQRAMVLGNCFFESSLLEVVRFRFMHPGMQIVEVGGNLGNHAVYFSKVAGAFSVVSFEPQPHLCEVFRRNLELNHVENVKVVPALCGATAGRGQIKALALNNLGATRFEVVSGAGSTPPHQLPAKTQSLISGGYPVVTLDEEITLGCDFLKIDAEGMETEVIKGAFKLIDRFHPVIMVELWDEEHVQNFVGQVAPLGYKSWFRYGVYDYVFTVGA